MVQQIKFAGPVFDWRAANQVDGYPSRGPTGRPDGAVDHDPSGGFDLTADYTTEMYPTATPEESNGFWFSDLEAVTRPFGDTAFACKSFVALRNKYVYTVCVDWGVP